jgi:hypothetical protein
MDMILGAILFLGGYLLCYFTQRPKAPEKKESEKKIVETVVKDFKNPLERYKKVTNSDGLYTPQRPRQRGVDNDEGRKQRVLPENKE